VPEFTERIQVMEEDNGNIVMVTAATFPEAIEAHIFRSRLEAEGIPCVIADENIVTIQPWHTIAYGGVKLRVRQQDQERAQALIAEIRSLEQPDHDRCPACHSDKIKLKRNVSLLNKVFTILFGVGSGKSKFICLNCGHEGRLS
jgi:hypothetical protein